MIVITYWENHFHAEVLPDRHRVSFDNLPYHRNVISHHLTSNNGYDSSPDLDGHVHVLSLFHHWTPLSMHRLISTNCSHFTDELIKIRTNFVLIIMRINEFLNIFHTSPFAKCNGCDTIFRFSQSNFIDCLTN